MAENANAVVAKELRSRAPAELRSLLNEKTDELYKARSKHALGQLRTTHTIKQLKRDIAVLNTVLSEQALAEKK